jgi:diguanylate cyclase (GGDEF)-like protein
MGRNAQKRRAKRAREAMHRGRGEPVEGSPDRLEDEAPTEARPLWLKGNLQVDEPLAGDEHADVLALAARCAAAAPPHAIAHAVADICGADAVLIAEVDDEEPTVLGRFRRARPAGDSGLLPLLTPELLGDVLAAGAPILIRDVPRDPRTPDVMPSERNGSLLAVALTERGQAPWGVLAIGRREVGALFERDVEIVANLAHHLGADLAQARALHEGMTDPVTGLLSRAGLLLSLDRQLERARRRERPLSALVLRLDDPGPQNAERVKALAERLADNVRTAELSGRLLGGEIVLLLEADLDEAEAAAKRVFRDVTEAPLAGASATLSGGVACAAPEEAGLALLARARAALKASVDAGGATIARHEPELSDDADEGPGDEDRTPERPSD